MSISVALLTTVGLVVGATAVAAPASAASKIQIVQVRFDSAGTDLPATNKKVNDEYVVIKNTDRVAHSITGWTLVDKSHHSYTFPATKLKAGASIKVRTGKGSDSSKNRYENRSYYIWNNTSDTATLRNAQGRGGDSCAWKTSDPGSTKVC